MFLFLIEKLKMPFWGVFTIVVLFIIVNNAENILLLKGWICGLFSKFSTKAAKESLSAKVRGCILKSTNRFDDLEKDIIPSDLSVEWVKEEEQETFINNDTVIVRIKKSNNPQENLITATAAYVNEGLLHNHRRYIDHNVIQASNYAMIRNIVEYSGKNSVTYFEEKYLPLCLGADEEVADIYSQLRAIDKNGMFINILLKEFLKASDLLFGDEPDPCLIAESRQLVQFLYGIATREFDENTELELNSNYFKIAVVLTGKDATLRNKGLYPYLKVVSEHIKADYDTVYMLGIGSKIVAAEEIARQINEDSSNMIFATQRRYKHVFKDGKRKDAVIYEISTKM
jgi:hypothetical protein